MKEAKLFSVPQSRRWSLSEARIVVEALEHSGLPVTRFAARHGLGVERLYRWCRRLARVRSSRSGPARFTEIGLALPSSAWIELVLPDGIALRVSGATRVDDAMTLVSRLAGR
jgi:transposase-like protein